MNHTHLPWGLKDTRKSKHMSARGNGMRTVHHDLFHGNVIGTKVTDSTHLILVRMVDHGLLAISLSDVRLQW